MPEIGQRQRIRLDSDDAPGPTTHRETEQPPARVSVEKRVVGRHLERLSGQRHEHLGTGRVVLEERVGRDPEVRFGDRFDDPSGADDGLSLLAQPPDDAASPLAGIGRQGSGHDGERGAVRGRHPDRHRSGVVEADKPFEDRGEIRMQQQAGLDRDEIVASTPIERRRSVHDPEVHAIAVPVRRSGRHGRADPSVGDPAEMPELPRDDVGLPSKLCLDRSELPLAPPALGGVGARRHHAIG